ncbi:MAG: hypothetical protein IT255_03350 [Chitinophagaceae bacterium]|nr:hypothetical protein [Chitinophagaceae bacterium]
MKKIISMVGLLIVFIQNSKAQSLPTLPSPGSYMTNNTMGAFHGTWQWVSGSDTVKLFLNTQKVWIDYAGGFYLDCLVGWHLYKKGNTVIESSYSNINNGNTYTFMGGNENGPINKAEGALNDLTKHKEGDLTLTLNAANNELTWKLVNAEGVHIRRSTDPPFDYTFTLPKNMVLTKQ